MTLSSTAMRLAVFVLLASVAVTARPDSSPASTTPAPPVQEPPVADKTPVNASDELVAIPEPVLARHQLRVEQISTPMRRLLRREARRLMLDRQLDVSRVRDSLAFVFVNEQEAVEDTGGLQMDDLVQMVLIEALVICRDEAQPAPVASEPAPIRASPEAARQRYRILFAALTQALATDMATAAGTETR